MPHPTILQYIDLAHTIPIPSYERTPLTNQINKKTRLSCDKRVFNLVELSGIEPLTSTLPVLRSPS